MGKKVAFKIEHAKPEEKRYRCSKCQGEFPLEEMGRRKFRGKWQPTTWCKKCHRAYTAAYDAAKPEQHLERTKRYRARLKEQYG